MMFSKTESQTIHARKRFKERYYLSVSKQDMEKMVSQIRNHDKAVLIEKQTNRVSVWDLLWVDNQKIRVVYDRKRMNIVTAFPINLLTVNDNNTEKMV